MKNYKVFSLLAVATLLTACDTNKPSFSISKPKFVDKGQEITMQQFRDEVLAEFNKFELYSYHDGDVMGSKRVHTVQSYDKKGESKNQSEKSNSHKRTKEIVDEAFDAETKVGQISTNNRKYEYYTDPANDQKPLEDKQVQETYYIQKVRIVDENYIASVYPDKLLVKTDNNCVLDATWTEEKMFSMSCYSHLINQTNYLVTRYILNNLDSLEETELQRYKFYKNENTYTSIYTKEIDEDGEEHKIHNKVSAIETIQFTFAEHGLDYLFAGDRESKLTYLEDFSGKKKGDYEYYKEISYIDCKYEDSPSDVHIEAIDYTDFDAEVDVLY